MSENKPWVPTLENAKEFQEHRNPAVSDRDPPLRIPDPEEDTAPLQGSKDLSDPDSLEDVIADSYEPAGATAPNSVTQTSVSRKPKDIAPTLPRDREDY